MQEYIAIIPMVISSTAQILVAVFQTKVCSDSTAGIKSPIIPQRIIPTSESPAPKNIRRGQSLSLMLIII